MVLEGWWWERGRWECRRREVPRTVLGLTQLEQEQVRDRDPEWVEKVLA